MSIYGNGNNPYNAPSNWVADSIPEYLPEIPEDKRRPANVPFPEWAVTGKVTGSELQCIRTASGINRLDFAKFAGVAQTTVARWEREPALPEEAERAMLTLIDLNDEYTRVAGYLMRTPEGRANVMATAGNAVRGIRLAAGVYVLPETWWSTIVGNRLHHTFSPFLELPEE